MENKKFRRTHYFIHRSTQLKYICMSIIPAMLIGVFCIFLSINSGRLLSVGTKVNTLVGIDTIDSSVAKLMRDSGRDSGVDISLLLALRKDIISYRLSVDQAHYFFLKEWYGMMFVMIAGIFIVLLCVIFLAVLYSHRVAGPVMRISRCLNDLAQGKGVNKVTLRVNDEFKELAASFNNLIDSGRLK